MHQPWEGYNSKASSKVVEYQIIGGILDLSRSEINKSIPLILLTYSLQIFKSKKKEIKSIKNIIDLPQHN